MKPNLTIDEHNSIKVSGEFEAKDADGRKHAMLYQYDTGIARLRRASSKKVRLQISDRKICVLQVMN